MVYSLQIQAAFQFDNKLNISDKQFNMKLLEKNSVSMPEKKNSLRFLLYSANSNLTYHSLKAVQSSASNKKKRFFSIICWPIYLFVCLFDCLLNWPTLMVDFGNFYDSQNLVWPTNKVTSIFDAEAEKLRDNGPLTRGAIAGCSSSQLKQCLQFRVLLFLFQFFYFSSFLNFSS